MISDNSILSTSRNWQTASYSSDPSRNKQYALFLQSFDTREVVTKDIIDFGYKLMRKAKLHPHFFGKNTLLDVSRYLTLFVLKLPHRDNNPEHLIAKINQKEAEKIIELFEMRISQRIPVEYLTNEAWYLGNKFYVNHHVLVPRSIMSMRFKDFLNETIWENNHVLDLCTGSGCIGITLALLNPKLKVDLVDISSEAINVANININKFGLQDRVKCIQSDLFNNVLNKYDLIITNPPYVSSKEYKQCPAEFKNEPKIALESGKDGLDITHKILAQAKNYLNANGKLIAEVGYTAAKRLKKLYPGVPFKWYKYRNPEGKESFLGMHGVFECNANGLPTIS